MEGYFLPSSEGLNYSGTLNGFEKQVTAIWLMTKTEAKKCANVTGMQKPNAFSEMTIFRTQLKSSLRR